MSTHRFILALSFLVLMGIGQSLLKGFVPQSRPFPTSGFESQISDPDTLPEKSDSIRALWKGFSFHAFPEVHDTISYWPRISPKQEKPEAEKEEGIWLGFSGFRIKM